jgi:hypothetical protein
MSEMASTSPRRFVRRSVILSVQLLVADKSYTVPQNALVTDLTQAGAKIFSPVALEPGQTLRIVPSEGIPYAIPGRVVWSREIQAGDGHEGGLEFISAEN